MGSHLPVWQLLVVHVLILDLKTDNAKAFFILSGISFHNLGSKLVIVSVPNAPYALYFCLLDVYHS